MKKKYCTPKIEIIMFESNGSLMDGGIDSSHPDPDPYDPFTDAEVIGEDLLS